MARVKHEEALSGFEFGIESENPAQKGKNGNSFLESCRLKLLNAVGKKMFPLEKEGKKNDREDSDKGSMVLEGYFLVASETSVFCNIGVEYSLNHVNV